MITYPVRNIKQISRAFFPRIRHLALHRQRNIILLHDLLDMSPYRAIKARDYLIKTPYLKGPNARKQIDFRSKMLHNIYIYGLSGVNFGNLVIALNHPLYKVSVDVVNQKTAKTEQACLKDG